MFLFIQLLIRSLYSDQHSVHDAFLAEEYKLSQYRPRMEAIYIFNDFHFVKFAVYLGILGAEPYWISTRVNQR